MKENSILIKGNLKDISMILVSAERYALGRRTYIVSWICEVLKNNIDLLTENDIQVMIRDIEEAYTYGDECDEKEWKALLKKLKENQELNTRLQEDIKEKYENKIDSLKEENNAYKILLKNKLEE